MKKNIKKIMGADAVLTLTAREKEVFYMLLEGMKAREIASKTSITIWGANYFIKQIYRKLGVSSKTELILQYFDFRRPFHHS